MKWTAKLLCVFISAALVLTFARFTQIKASSAAEDPQEKLKGAVVLYVGSSGAIVDNRDTRIDPANLEVQPVVKNGRTLVPVRFITESLGARVDWDAKNSAVDVDLNGKTVKLVIGSREMKVDGKDTALEVPAEIINDRTFVPLRQLAEALGKKVFYDRGLIVVSDREDIFDAESDKLWMDGVIARVNNLPVVGTFENLKSLLEKAQSTSASMLYGGGVEKRKTINGATIVQDAKMSTAAADTAAAGPEANPGYSGEENSKAAGDYSATNTQVQGVDEADIVKTDGEYIYQVNKQRVIIARAYPAEEMKISSVLDFTDKNFIPQELYLDGRKLVVIGSTCANVPVYTPETKDKAEVYPPAYYYRNTVKAVVYDITDRTKPGKLRELEVEGNYVSSRKIGSTLYMIANKAVDYYTIQQQSQSAAPCYRDTAVKEDFINIDYGEIRYFPGLLDTNYMTVAALDLDKMDEKAGISTYLGAGQNIYASPENLYVAVTKYSPAEVKPAEAAGEVSILPAKRRVIRAYDNNTLVYKFSLNNSQVTYLNKGEVPGTILNQFSMDEYGKYFRIATTRGNILGTGENASTNNVYILDETLSITGKIEDMAPGEKIYSVRFMGDRGYVVTFKKVDPLFVIDLKDPYKPGILGALKIPGYSDYLHPYDENHILGFGKDAVEVSQKDWQGNDAGTTAFYQGMKIALFDVTDVNHPRQMFSEVIGDRGTDSELLRDHKALLFSKSKNLLAFPVTLMEIKEGNKIDAGGFPQYGQFTFQGAYVYGIDLEKGFTLKGRITHLTDEEYRKAGGSWYDSDKNVERILYLDNTLYTLSRGMIKANDITDLKEKNTLRIP
ncbi:MAG: beta-propeller domain-containing protein [Clostridiales bacterium]|jgi:uncharacterized secreted protein with C-terminal beta-propeller domain|nr:beta-propeller domain-containing protein [Eubacteriales bacterium]MDH7566112.1 beta-propeller domain-containing protein [Clostridiales bacterium]